MLAIGPGFTPDHRACGIRYGNTVTVNRFPVAFHISLLKISRKTMHASDHMPEWLPFANQRRFRYQIPRRAIITGYFFRMVCF